MGNTIARATGHIPSVANGKDAVTYEIVPDTYAVSLDADGNWAEGTTTTVWDGEECARVFCTFIKRVGGVVSSPEEYLSLVSGDKLFDISKYVGYAYIKKSDTSVNLSLYTLNEGNPPTYSGELLDRCTILVNRAGSNGTSVNIQYSKDGISWHDAYAKGDIYMRIKNGSSWSAAIKFVGDNGTSFTPKGTASGHFDKASNISTQFALWTMLVDVNDKYPPLSSSPSVIEKSGDGYVAREADVGDGYVVDGHIWVCSENDGWVDFGNIKGADGESVYVTENSVTYGISGDAKNPASVKMWTSSIPDITAEQPYLWVKNYLRFSDDTETVSYTVTTRGNRGAVFRQHVGFVSEDYSYQSGGGTEEFIDVVKVGKVWYRCIQSYNSKDTPTANDVTNTKFWSTSGMTNMDFIATQLLLAEDATINMLGTNEINLYNGDTRFGSFRVPHGTEGVDGDADGGKYAFWLGGVTGGYAPYSVTKDGRLYATNAYVAGTVNATSGKIGAFNLNSNGTLTIGEADSNGYRSFGMSDNSIYFTHKTGDKVDSIMWLGRAEQLIGGDRGTSNLWLEDSEETPTRSKACLYLKASGYTGGETNMLKELRGNFAIYAIEGMYAGFRPAIRTISSSTQLTDMDCVVCCNAKDIAVALPESPKKGQMVYIFQEYSGKVTITSKNYAILANSRKTAFTLESNVQYQGTILFFTGDCWIGNWING